MIIGTAGHIDHGKTALVKALTGVDGDRLKEEKARGLTIELGFAYLPAPSGEMLGFVDVPGHERFVHTMLAGAGGIDFALVVIAANEGFKPQTDEHLAIVDLLGIGRGVVVLTKADLVDAERIAGLTTEVRARLAGTALARADVLPVSALRGTGVDDLRARLFAAAAVPVARPQGCRFRLAVDRVFTLKGIGVVVTGTILSGAVGVDDRVVVSPAGLEARVRSVHAGNRPAQAARAGERCALNLAGAGITQESVRRGDVVLDPVLHAPTDRIDATFVLLPDAARPMGQWFPARLHHAAADVGARVVLLRDAALKAGEACDVQLVLDRPIAAAATDRFVLRDASARATIGGGRFIDLAPPQRRRRTPERQAQRAALRRPEAEAAFTALLAAPPFVHNLDGFARDRAMSDAQLNALVERIDPVLLVGAGFRLAMAAERWRTLASGCRQTLAAFHTDHPDHRGLGRERLRQATEPRLPASAFAAALRRIVGDGDVVIEGAFVRLATHRVNFAPHDAHAWATVASLLDGGERFRPPRVRDIAVMLERPEDDIRRLLKVADRMGLAEEIAPDHFFLRASVHAMVGVAADIAAHTEGAAFTAAQFRDRLANGRKVAIQILDFFDARGVTLRAGDLRRVDSARLDLFAPL